MSKTTHNEKAGQAIGQGTRNPNPRARALMQDREQNLPVWIRAPMRGQEHFTGLTRPKLYELSGRKLIVSVSIRQPGQVRGCRLFNLPSILAYLDRLVRENTVTDAAN